LADASSVGYSVRSRSTSRLVMVADLDVIRVAVDKPKADTPLSVHRDRVLPLTFILERMQTIAGRHPQVIQARRQVDVFQFANGSPTDLGGSRLVVPVVNRSRVRLSANVLIIGQR